MNNEEIERLQAQLERLPTQIRQYYGAYFSELRSQLTRSDLFSEAVPDFFKGYKRVISIGGRDGLVVAHFPIEQEITFSENNTGKILIRFPSVPDAVKDTFEFITFPELPVADLVKFISGGEDIGAISPGGYWGEGIAGRFNEPQLKADPHTGRLTWRAPWTRLDYADFNHLCFWEDTERARGEAREDIEPYVRGSEHKELDEIRAPKAIEEAGVEAGDRGVVVKVFEHPRPALLVEYTDSVGQTKALVTYSTNLEEIYDVILDHDFLANCEEVLGGDEMTQEQETIPIPAHWPPIRGLVPVA